MTDKLKKAFEIYMKENLLGIDEDHILEYLNNNGYELNSTRRNETIDAYMKVTNDPVLSALIPELPSYDLNNPGTDIRTLYDVKKREMDLKTAEEKTVEQVVEEPKKDSTISMVEDQKRYNKQIEKNMAETQNVMVQEPTAVVDTELPKPSVLLGEETTTPTVENKKGMTLKKDLTPTGYANVVLMSIIVIVIVAIICVFIFA